MGTAFQLLKYSSFFVCLYFTKDAVGISVYTSSVMVTVNNNTERVPKEAAVVRFGQKFDFSIPVIKTEVSLLKAQLGFVFCR